MRKSDCITKEKDSFIPSELKTFLNPIQLCDANEAFVKREELLKEIIKALCIKKESVILVGEPGCGKTTLVRELSSMIETCENKWLHSKKIYQLSSCSLVADTKYRGEFEKKLEKLLLFWKSYSENLIIFADEMHQLYNLGCTDGNPMSIMNILKLPLENREITMIGATTKSEFKTYLMQDPAFLRRCKIFILPELDIEEKIRAVLLYIDFLEKKWRIKLNLFQKNEAFTFFSNFFTNEGEKKFSSDIDKNDQKYNIIRFIVGETDKNKQRTIEMPKLDNLIVAKEIFEDAFIEAVYCQKSEVSLEELRYAISHCEYFTPTHQDEIIFGLEEICKSKAPSKLNCKILSLKPY